MEIRPSIVIPVYNEKDNLGQLAEELKKVMERLHPETEVIFVDDGSNDGSTGVLKEIAEDGRFRVLVHGRNYGQTAALMTGIGQASGNVVVTMDADLQNDPADIPMLLAGIEDGCDVVSGWRRNRRDAFFSRRLPSMIANMKISWFTGVKLHDYGCTLKAYRSEFIKNLSLQGEMHRFIPVYCRWQGAEIKETEVNHRRRIHGKSKYSINRVFKVMLDLAVVKFLMSYLGKPIYVFGGMAIASLAGGTVVTVYVIVRKVFMQGEWLSPLFFIGILLWTFGVTCFLLGLLAEVVVRLYLETGRHPVRRVREKINITE